MKAATRVRQTAEATATLVRIILPFFFAAIAVALAACRDKDPGPPPSDAAVTGDADDVFDASMSVDASLQSDTNASTGDASDAMTDTSIEDVVAESSQSDMSAVDSDASPPIDPDTSPPIDPDASPPIDPDTSPPIDPDASPPADSAIPDADVAVPDGSEPIDPVFATCAYMPSIQIAPYAIIDALPGYSIAGQCHCSGIFYPLTYRVLCGTYTPPAIVDHEICLCTSCQIPNAREIYILTAMGCVHDAGPGTSMGLWDHRPVSDWDALMAEQIAGHADAGGHD